MNDNVKIAHKAKAPKALLCAASKIRSLAVWLIGLMFFCTPNAHAFRVIDTTSEGFGILRWNAAPHFVDGVERSLDGGLRYSVVGGSYEAFRDELSWVGAPPSVADFQNAVESAFAAWETVDGASGLGTNLSFVPDFDTVVVDEGPNGPFTGLNRGAEIDLIIFRAPPFIPGGSSLFADASPEANSVTLTSGVESYPAGVISGADIGFNANFAYDLEQFQGNLTHSIGSSLGLAGGDLHPDIYGDELSQFYDDDYDETRALETLTNSFSHLIDPLDPNNSPGLGLYEVCDPNLPGGPLHKCVSGVGIRTPGVDNVMENFPPTPHWPTALQNDDFAGRQFLYPFTESDVVDAAVEWSSEGRFDVSTTPLPTAINTFAAESVGDVSLVDVNFEHEITALEGGVLQLNNGHFRIRAENGDVLDGTYTDFRYTPVEDESGLFDGSGSFEFIGGSGVFFGASGGGSWMADAGFDEGSASMGFANHNWTGQLNLVANPLPGDIDGDGTVAFTDFLILSANFDMDVDKYTSGDFDGNGKVEFSDFLKLSENFGQASAVAAPVPEPSSVLLLIIGLASCRIRRCS